MSLLAAKVLFFLVRWYIVGTASPVMLNQRAESELALFVLYVMEMLKSTVHLIKGSFLLKLHLTFKNKLHTSTLVLAMKLQLLVSGGLLLLCYTWTAIYSAKFLFWSIWLSKVSCTYFTWNVHGSHYHQYLNTSQTANKHIFLRLFKGVIVLSTLYT